MEAIYPFTALKTNQRELKNAASNDIVHITENGKGAFVFCSEEVFERRVSDAVAEAVYAERLAASIRQGREEIAQGHHVEGTQNAIDAIMERRAHRG